MLAKSLFLLLVAAIAYTTTTTTEAFSPVAAPFRISRTSAPSATALQAVVDIDSEAAFDKTIQSAGDSLVIVDYSTTWCGPCKVIAPKFEELSEKYPYAVFLKVGKTTTPMYSSTIV